MNALYSAGDYLKLGDTDVMYEIVKKAFDERLVFTNQLILYIKY